MDRPPIEGCSKKEVLAEANGLTEPQSGIGQTSSNGYSIGLCQCQDDSHHKKSYWIRINMLKLHEEIEPDIHLKAALISHKVFSFEVIKGLWSVKDDVIRIDKMLTSIMQRDDETFDRFCKALIQSGQTHIIPYLTSHHIEEEDRYAKDTPPDFRGKVPEEILLKNWNFVIHNMETDNVFLQRACDDLIITRTQSKSLKSEDDAAKRNDKFLCMMMKKSLGHYKRFITLLENTGQKNLSLRLSEAAL